MCSHDGAVGGAVGGPDDSGRGGGGVLDDLEALAVKLADLDAVLVPGHHPGPGRSAGSDVMHAAVQIQRVKDLVSVTESALLAHLQATQVTDQEVGLLTGPWLARAAEQPKSACSRRVRTSEQLHRYFAFLVDIVREGWLAWAHVDVIIGASNPRNRPDMVAECPEYIRWATDTHHHRFDRWATKVRRRAVELDADGGYDPNDDVHANRFRISELPDATREISGRLVGAAGVTVTETLEQIAEEIHRSYRASHATDPEVEIPNQGTLMALALEEACRRALARPAGSTAPPRTEAVIVIEADDDGHARVSTPNGSAVPHGAADALLWNADVRAMLVDTHGSPLWLGRTMRLATRDQRLALAIRDRGCLHPGCDAPPKRTQAHHMPAWADGGTTDVDAQGEFCGRHHPVIHRKGWHQAPDPKRTQEWIITTPTGRTLHTERNT